MVGVYISSRYLFFLQKLMEGTFALCSAGLGKQLDMAFFKITGCIVTCAVTILWFVVAFRTVVEGVKGKIFYAPCLASAGGRIPEEMTAPAPRSTVVINSSTGVGVRSSSD
jgi:hypothetical protein